MNIQTSSAIQEARLFWLAALRDPGAGKAVGMLEDRYDSTRRCCLGHACHALGVERTLIRHPEDDDFRVYYEDQADRLPDATSWQLDITPAGLFQAPLKKADLIDIVGRDITLRGAHVLSLMDLNDLTDLMPSEIADVIELQFATNQFVRYEKNR